jgi:F-type H+-transporting ATPase subunit delta
MSSGSVARRYARALFDLAVEAKAVDDVTRDLDLLTEAVGDVEPDWVAPGALDSDLRERIGSAIAEKAGGDTLIGRFAHLLARKDRLSELAAIRECFRKIRDAAEGRVRIDVVTATPLTDAELEKLISTFSAIAGRRVVPSARIDARLLGGAIVEMEGKVFDGSVRTTLERLSARMAGGDATSSEV